MASASCVDGVDFQSTDSRPARASCDEKPRLRNADSTALGTAPSPASGGGARDDLELGHRVEPGFSSMITLAAVRGADAARAPDRSRILAHDGALEDLQARGAQDVEANLRADAVDLDQHLEKLQLLDGGEAVESELVLADVGVDVQLDSPPGAGSCWRVVARR